MSHEAIFLATSNAMALNCKFQGRLPRVTPHVSQQKIALQVAEKVEAASTFRNATQQVAACDTSTATCLASFLRRNQSQCDIIGMPLTFNLIAGRKTSCVRLTS